MEAKFAARKLPRNQQAEESIWLIPAALRLPSVEELTAFLGLIHWPSLMVVPIFGFSHERVTGSANLSFPISHPGLTLKLNRAVGEIGVFLPCMATGPPIATNDF